VINGWILDPDRKKMSKSRGKVVTPMELFEQYGSDAVRYWAASGRPGTDLAFDAGQIRVGRRLATKLLNASRFVLGLDSSGASTAITALDRAMLAALSGVVAAATSAFEGYDHTTALTATEAFFWTFCDDYIELVKERAYGAGAGASSARAALVTALDVQLRLFAPFLPYATEEVWSWRADAAGSVHRSSWPAVDSLDHGGDAGLLSLIGEALGRVRRAKSERRLSMRVEVPLVEVRGTPEQLRRLAEAEADLRSAGRIADLKLITSDRLQVTVHL
jgi:valyl-tRNA synthetase